MKFTKEKFKAEAKSLIIIVLIVFSFRSVFFEPFQIPTGSMIPTLNIGDFILVNKFAYGFKVPFSDMFSDPTYITEFKSPKRGDVIVFKYPKDHSLNYIKRLIGLPGDEIELYKKQLYINGQKLDMRGIDGKDYTREMVDKFKKISFRFYKEKIDGKEHVLQVTNRDMTYDTFDKIVVPKDHYFAMGDNRDFSADSRVWGFVPKENIKGKAVLVWFSLSLPFTLLPPGLSENSFKFRPTRIGTRIE